MLLLFHLEKYKIYLIILYPRSFVRSFEYLGEIDNPSGKQVSEVMVPLKRFRYFVLLTLFGRANSSKRLRRMT